MRRGAPVTRSYAASLPETPTMTRSPATNGELAKPHVGVFTAASEAALRDHTTTPLLASSAFTIPVAPNVYARPLPRVGVPRGPGPPFDSQKRAASRCAHTGSPVASL